MALAVAARLKARSGKGERLCGALKDSCTVVICLVLNI